MDEAQAQTQPAPAPVKPKPFTPTAIHITQRPPSKMLEALNPLKMDGNGHPVRLSAAQAAAQSFVEAFQDADNVELRIETSGTENGHQILVQVIKHKF